MARFDRAWECHHCKAKIKAGEFHDCWTTTEAALTRELPEHVQEAYERLRETAAEFGEQRIYASHKCIMFSRKSCYFFVRPKRTFLEVCVFLGRRLKAPQVRRALPASKTKVAHLIPIRHRDEVEAPLTDWMQEAYDFSVAPVRAARPVKAGTRRPPKQREAGKPTRKAATPSRKTARPTRRAGRRKR